MPCAPFLRATATTLAVLAALLACADESPQPVSDGPDLLFVLIDTLRADRVGA